MYSQSQHWVLNGSFACFMVIVFFCHAGRSRGIYRRGVYAITPGKAVIISPPVLVMTVMVVTVLPEGS